MTADNTTDPTREEVREAFQNSGDGLDFKKSFTARGVAFDRFMDGYMPIPAEIPEDARRITLDGVSHRFEVYRNINNTGWLFQAWHMGSSTVVNVPTEQGRELAALLLHGPGEIDYYCAKHRKISNPCLPCLRGDDDD